jgi:hypothetical protein
VSSSELRLNSVSAGESVNRDVMPLNRKSKQICHGKGWMETSSDLDSSGSGSI